jgi:hypothetical protein
MLELEQSLRATLEGSVEGGQLGDSGHATTLTSTFDKARAAARPDRTALSIVTGQPVFVHAPARTTLGRDDRVPARSCTVPGRKATVARGSRDTRDQIRLADPSRSVT